MEPESGRGPTNGHGIGAGNFLAVLGGRAIDRNVCICRQHVMLAAGRTVHKAQEHIGCQRKS